MPSSARHHREDQVPNCDSANSGRARPADLRSRRGASIVCPVREATGLLLGAQRLARPRRSANQGSDGCSNRTGRCR